MFKKLFGFFSGIIKIIIGVVVALLIFATLLSKGCEHVTLKKCKEGKLPASFCQELQKELAQ